MRSFFHQIAPAIAPDCHHHCDSTLFLTTTKTTPLSILAVVEGSGQPHPVCWLSKQKHSFCLTYSFYPNMNSTTPSTKDDKNIAAAFSIRTVASDLTKLNSVLSAAIAALENPTVAALATTRKSLDDLKTSLISSSIHLQTNIKILDPISSLDCVHKKQK